MSSLFWISGSLGGSYASFGTSAGRWDFLRGVAVPRGWLVFSGLGAFSFFFWAAMGNATLVLVVLVVVVMILFFIGNFGTANGESFVHT